MNLSQSNVYVLKYILVKSFCKAHFLQLIKTLYNHYDVLINGYESKETLNMFSKVRKTQSFQNHVQGHTVMPDFDLSITLHF